MLQANPRCIRRPIYTTEPKRWPTGPSGAAIPHLQSLRLSLGHHTRLFTRTREAADTAGIAGA